MVNERVSIVLGFRTIRELPGVHFIRTRPPQADVEQIRTCDYRWSIRGSIDTVVAVTVRAVKNHTLRVTSRSVLWWWHAMEVLHAWRIRGEDMKKLDIVIVGGQRNAETMRSIIRNAKAKNGSISLTSGQKVRNGQFFFSTSATSSSFSHDQAQINKMCCGFGTHSSPKANFHKWLIAPSTVSKILFFVAANRDMDLDRRRVDTGGHKWINVRDYLSKRLQGIWRDQELNSEPRLQEGGSPVHLYSGRRCCLRKREQWKYWGWCICNVQ